MKKFLLLACTSLFINLIHATTYNIQVVNYSFSPATVNATVGDTIKWTWVSGFHTTTSTSVPAGAATWDAPMDPSNTSYTYPLTVAGAYSYLCIPHSGFMTAALNVSAVLPVVLTDFHITASGNTANLLWHTAGEQNIATYIIKKSNDGTNFTAIGEVKALNTSINAYSFRDDALNSSDKYVYYYIDIADKNGSHTTSSIQSFKNVFAKSGLLRQVSPNPVSGTDHLMLQFYADKPGTMLTQLYSAGGALVKQAQITAAEGINNAHFHTGALAAGTYLLQCTLDDKQETRQIVVQ